jgi:hypothetical protein
MERRAKFFPWEITGEDLIVFQVSSSKTTKESAMEELTQLPQFDQQVLGCQREEGRVSTT